MEIILKTHEATSHLVHFYKKRGGMRVKPPLARVFESYRRRFPRSEANEEPNFLHSRYHKWRHLCFVVVTHTR